MRTSFATTFGGSAATVYLLVSYRCLRRADIAHAALILPLYRPVCLCRAVPTIVPTQLTCPATIVSTGSTGSDLYVHCGSPQSHLRAAIRAIRGSSVSHASLERRRARSLLGWRHQSQLAQASRKNEVPRAPRMRRVAGSTCRLKASIVYPKGQHQQCSGAATSRRKYAPERQRSSLYSPRPRANQRRRGELTKPSFAECHETLSSAAAAPCQTLSASTTLKAKLVSATPTWCRAGAGVAPAAEHVEGAQSAACAMSSARRQRRLGQGDTQ